MSKTKKQRNAEQTEESFRTSPDMVDGQVCLTQEEVQAAIHALIVAEYLARAPKKTEAEKQQEPAHAKRGYNK